MAKRITLTKVMDYSTKGCCLIKRKKRKEVKKILAELIKSI